MKKNKHHSPETRKQQILLAAEIVLLKEGIQNFTIDQVISHAQIAKGTVYKYYKSRDHLLAEMAVKAVEMLFMSFKSAATGMNSSMEKLRAVIKACYHFYRNYPQYYGLLNYFERTDVNADEKEKYVTVSFQLQQFIEDIISQGKESGEIETPVSDRYLDFILWSSCVGMIQFIENKKDLIPNFKEINQEQLMDDFASIITNGFRK
ncbi:TetR/AcrR family transcriptional regulator [Algoriphagus namhaensis]